MAEQMSRRELVLQFIADYKAIEFPLTGHIPDESELADMLCQADINAGQYKEGSEAHEIAKEAWFQTCLQIVHDLH